MILILGENIGYKIKKNVIDCSVFYLKGISL